MSERHQWIGRCRRRDSSSRGSPRITMKRLGLRYVSTDELTIRRKRVGDELHVRVGAGAHHPR